MSTKQIVLLLCIFCIPCLGFNTIQNSHEKQLQVWWKSYKKKFVLRSGCVQRPESDYDTVSEGQAYSMLFSVFMNDKKTFDLIYRWTEEHLSRYERNGDHLLAWYWKDGNVEDWMPASDADCDYAFALMLASYKWREKAYVEKAVSIINDVMKYETVRGNSNRLFLLPGMWGNQEDETLIQNPSYYHPASFRLFYENTQDSRWLDLIETGYWILSQTANRLGNINGCGLTPDWCTVDSKGNVLIAEGKSNNYGWEAIRVPMQVGLDVLWYKSEKGREILEKIYYALKYSNAEPGDIKAVYSYTGEPVVKYSSLAATGMAYFAAQVLNYKTDILKPLLKNIINEDSSIQNYYGQSLAFYPLALEGGILQKPQSPHK